MKYYFTAITRGRLDLLFWGSKKEIKRARENLWDCAKEILLQVEQNPGDYFLSHSTIQQPDSTMLAFALIKRGVELGRDEFEAIFSPFW